jgi:hypothetical protein
VSALGFAGHSADVCAGNAEVCEAAIGQGAEFSYSRAVIAPVVVRACQVHFSFSFRELPVASLFDR